MEVNMISTAPTETFERLHRNVSSNYIAMIPADIRGDYVGQGTDGVYTTGLYGSNADTAIAVTGMASCGGLILSSASGYLAIHIAGEARGVDKFADLITNWIKDNRDFFVIGATGPNGSEDFVLQEFEPLIEKLTGKNKINFTIYKNVAKIAVKNQKAFTPDKASVAPAIRARGKCCVIM
jgi:hypothetical protein